MGAIETEAAGQQPWAGSHSLRTVRQGRGPEQHPTGPLVLGGHHIHAVMDAVTHINVEAGRWAKQGLVGGGTAALAMAGRFALAVGLRLHHHTPQVAPILLAPQQQTPHQLGGNHCGRAGEEPLRQGPTAGGGNGDRHGTMMQPPAATGMGTPEPTTITIPVSLGELIDKITILEIKVERIGGPAQANVAQELAWLNGRLEQAGLAIDADLRRQLRQVNLKLWTIEDDIRDREREQDFGAAFIALARAVYRTNDERAALKRRLNELHGSALVEEKSYRPY